VETSWTSEELTLILKNGHLRKFPKNQIIFYAGAVCNEVYYINKGWVNIYSMTDEGKRVSVGLRNNGEFVGISEIFCRSSWQCFGQALAEVEVYAIELKNLYAILDNHPTILGKFLTLTAHRLQEANTTMLNYVCKQAPGRLAITLLNLAEKSPNEKNGKVKVSIKLTQEELAAIISTTRQSAGRIINSFKKLGFIEMKGRQIEAIYPEKLRAKSVGKI
jgi:cAMP-binding proteins - catabolite gene activator and regulatory subunit of cAMP-dependent protein kinases